MLWQRHLDGVFAFGHANALKAYLSAYENLLLGLATQGVAVAGSALFAALEEEGLAALADVPVQRLSAGQQRRVALTRVAFAGDRKLWILDEPFSSLDNAAVKAVVSRDVWRHFRRDTYVGIRDEDGRSPRNRHTSRGSAPRI